MQKYIDEQEERIQQLNEANNKISAEREERGSQSLQTNIFLLREGKYGSYQTTTLSWINIGSMRLHDLCFVS